MYELYTPHPASRPEDFDQHYVTGSQLRTIAQYELHEAERIISIQDPIWGEAIIGREPGDEVFIDLFTHPVFQRLTGIEQLTLPKPYATMPDSFDFTRWEHVWGSVVFVRNMLHQAEEQGREFTPQEKIEMQLRTLLSDAGHTAFSHLGDWIKQSFGGSEDSHDLTLPDYLEKSGVNAILRHHNIDPVRVTMPEDADDFVECPSPDLCTDRVDYGCREISRWVDPASEGMWRDCFSIDDQNRLIMKNKAVAEYFSMAFGLLATEHWGHPVHRLQLQLFADLVKGALLDGTSALDDGRMHPYDRLYTVDNDVIANIRARGLLNNDLHALMLDTARAQRRVFAWNREGEIAQFLSAFRPDANITPSRRPSHFPNAMQITSARSEYAGAQPQNIELIRANDILDIPRSVKDFGKNPSAIDIFLPPLKARGIDPLYYGENGEVHRVSEDNKMAMLLHQPRKTQAGGYVARIYMAPSAKRRLTSKMKQIQEAWDAEAAKPRTSESEQALYDALGYIGGLAIGTSVHKIHVL
jgi:hypothetical protein